MATGRDDFVIAIRSAFLKKKDKQKFSLLTLIFLSILVIVLSNFNFKADTWYLDGFSPKTNPSAWTEKLFQEIYKHTNWRGSLSTFTVAGYVRRGLQKSGFCVSKTKGFGKKKEILEKNGFFGKKTIILAKKR